MHVVFVLLLSLTIHSVAIQAVSLLDALRHANASIFAQHIESDPTLLAFYLSDDVKTVFAPVDSVTSSRSVSSFSKLRLRAPGDVTQEKYQTTRTAQSAKNYNTHPGEVIPTNSKSQKLSPDTNQSVVAHGADNENTSSNSDTAKPVYRRQYLSTNNTNATGIQQIKISSGLGNNVSIIQGDIPYDGGLIHLVDG